MAGRAGRRGIDVVGNVIHLPNLYLSFELTSFKKMLSKKSQTLASKFRISYNLVFNCISKTGACTVKDITSYVRKSMINQEIMSESSGIENTICTLKEELQKCESFFKFLKTPIDVVESYIALLAQRPGSVNKRRKEIDRSISKILDEHKHVEKEQQWIINHTDKLKELMSVEDELKNCHTYIDKCVKNVLYILTHNHFIFNIQSDDHSDTFAYIFSEKGKHAQHFRESNCLLFSTLYGSNVFDPLDEKQIACFFSCFTNVSVSEDNKETRIPDGYGVKGVAEFSFNYLSVLSKEEKEMKIHTGVDFEMHFELISYVSEWWDAQDESECKRVLQKLGEEKGISLGDFVKALLKINNMVDELSKVAEINGDVLLMNKLTKISASTLKFVATNQSLYV